MKRNPDLSFPASVLAMLFVLALIVAPIAAGGEGALALKASLFLIVEILVILIISATVKVRGSQDGHKLRNILREVSGWKMPLYFPVSIAGIVLIPYVIVLVGLSVWAVPLLYLLMTIGLVYLFSDGPRSLWRATKTVWGFAANLIRNLSILGVGALGVVALVAIPLVLLYLFIRFVKWAWVG